VNILQITKKFPYPVIDGEVIAINNLTSGFAALGHKVTVLSLNTQKHHFDLENLPAAQKQQADYLAVDIDTSVRPLDAFFNLFTSKSYNIERFWSAQFAQKLAAVLAGQKFDLIIAETIYAMRYIDVIRKNTTAKVALRAHNVEYLIWQRLYKEEINPLKKLYLKLLAERLKTFELEHLNKADLLLPVSNADMQQFKAHDCTIPWHVAPIGYDLNLPDPDELKEENAVAFIGSLDWMPNREGVEWFIKEVWLKVVEQVPDAKFYLAGRNFPEDIKRLNVQGLIVVGEVDDARKFVGSKAISVVPLFAGSGMRVKIIEAMALGRAVISTTIGAEGINYTHGADILIADNAHGFAAAVVKILRSNALRRQLGQQAKQLVNTRYNNLSICSAIIDFCKPYL
jgi:glycosyltransferase involved in cell wall biosynthesis